MQWIQYITRPLPVVERHPPARDYRVSRNPRSWDGRWKRNRGTLLMNHVREARHHGVIKEPEKGIQLARL